MRSLKGERMAHIQKKDKGFERFGEDQMTCLRLGSSHKNSLWQDFKLENKKTLRMISQWSKF